MFVEQLATPVEKKMALSIAEMLENFTSEQRLIVDQLGDGEYVYPARYIANDLRLSPNYVLKQLRWFKKIGIANYGVLRAEDDHRICGSGYWLNRLGLDLQHEIHKKWGLERQD